MPVPRSGKLENLMQHFPLWSICLNGKWENIKQKKLMKTNDFNILSVSVMYINVHISPKYQVLLWALQNQQEMPL